MPIPKIKPQQEKPQKFEQAWRGQKRPKESLPPERKEAPGYRGSKNIPPARKNLSLIRKKIFRFFLAFGFLALVIGLIGGGLLFLRISHSLPDPGSLIDRSIAQSTQIFDRSGETLLYDVHGAEKRTLVSLGRIPEYLQDATIAIEDKDFYKHKGISFWAIFRTAIKNALTGSRAGASTLTQQFIKNAVLSNEKTYTRKIKEAIMAYRVEEKFTKDEILQMYLNEIPYGSTAYGVEAASKYYFNKHVEEINLAEAAILAALPQAPSRYSPYGGDRQALIDRQHYILDIMVSQKYITKEEAEAAKQAELVFAQPKETIIAPHFVMYVREQLAAKYGEKIIEESGLKIYTTLDLYKQKLAEETITEHAEKIKSYNASNAALVSIDPKTGQILAMVGSRDYFNDEIDGQVNIATSLRQPGSSLKPLVYAATFEKGYTPNTILYDVVTNFNTGEDKDYAPHNYDGKERGPISMRKALAGSLNVPAVKAIYLAGVKNVSALAKDLGYSSLGDPDRFGLSLVLGGAEVTMLEHANAYSAFARDGQIHPLVYIMKIEDKDGHVLEEFKPQKEKQVFSPETARLINDVLSDNQARSYVFGEKNYLTLPGRPVAAKTGTTNDYRDAWTIGYTPSLVSAVWVGNNDNRAMKRGADGSQVAAPIWQDYMRKVLGDSPIEGFKKPENIKTGKLVLDGESAGISLVEIDKASGLLATELTPPIFREKKVYFNPRSILTYVNKDDPLGPAPEHPEDDPQFARWERAIAKWAASTTPEQLKELAKNLNLGAENDNFPEILLAAAPTEKDNVHTEENKPKFRVDSPRDKQVIDTSLLYVNIIGATAPRGIKRAEYYLDGNLFFTNTEYPFNLAHDIQPIENGSHVLVVQLCDDIDNCAKQEITFELKINNPPVITTP